MVLNSNYIEFEPGFIVPVALFDRHSSFFFFVCSFLNIKVFSKLFIHEKTVISPNFPSSYIPLLYIRLHQPPAAMEPWVNFVYISRSDCKLSINQASISRYRTMIACKQPGWSQLEMGTMRIKCSPSALRHIPSSIWWENFRNNLGRIETHFRQDPTAMILPYNGK